MEDKYATGASSQSGRRKAVPLSGWLGGRAAVVVGRALFWLWPRLRCAAAFRSCAEPLARELMSRAVSCTCVFAC